MEQQRMNLITPLPQTIALMDSHPLALLGLTALVQSITPASNILIQETSLGRISEALMYQSVDILITDLQSAEESLQEGQDVLLQLASQFPDLNIVVYTFCHDSEALWKLFNQHNISLIARGKSVADTEGYFKKAFAQQRVLSPKICDALSHINDNNDRVISSLTRSEMDVLKLLLTGMDLQQIAKMKALSIKTVSAHKCNAMRKLGVKSDSELFMLLNSVFKQKQFAPDAPYAFS